MPTKTFAEKCYSVLRKVPAGQVTTYSEIAKAIGSKAYRAVGTAMKNNPYAPEVPCHRVVKADGQLGGFAGGQKKKIRLLNEEGIQVKSGRIVNFKEVIYYFAKPGRSF